MVRDEFMETKYNGHIHRYGTPRVTLYIAGHLHTAVPHCSHSRAPIVHTAVPRENNEHGCVYLRCRAVCKLPGCVEGHPRTPIFDKIVVNISKPIKTIIIKYFGGCNI